MGFKTDFLENKVGMNIPELDAGEFHKGHWWSSGIHRNN
jgi:hypothetical protein